MVFYRQLLTMQDESDKKKIVCTCYATGHGKEGVAVWDPYAEFESTTLPNGLTVHAAHWPGRSWEAVGFLIHSGAAQDPAGYEGVAHFVEHLVSANANIPSQKIRDFFNDNGGQVNLGTCSYAYTIYSFFVPAKRAVLANAFLTFGQMLLSAQLKNHVEREREIILREFRQSYPTKGAFALRMREHSALYGGHWLERHIDSLGTSDSIAHITEEEVQRYYDAHYTPANISIVGVGGMALSEIVELLEQSPFAVHKKGARTPLPIPLTKVTPPLETRHVFRISEHVNTKEVLESGGYESIAKIPGSINGKIVGIVSAMLDEVLFEEVRERRRWTYSISTSYYNFGEFRKFSISCGAITLQAIDKIEDVVNACIDVTKDRHDLFEKMKRRAIAYYQMSDTTGKKVCENALQDLSEAGRIVSLEEIVMALELITMEDVQACFSWLTPERRWTSIFRP